MSRVVVGLAILGLIPFGAALAQPTAAPSPGVPVPATKPAATGKAGQQQQKSLDALIVQGRLAAAADEFKAARDDFADAVTIDPRNAAALAGLTYAYVQLDDITRAKVMVERALAAGPPDQPLVVNASSVFLRLRNPMRAVKFIRDYLTAHPAELSQPLLDAMGAALTQADEATRAQNYFKECAGAYEAFNAKLEMTRPGEKRWGSQWLPARDADKKNKAYLKNRDELANAEAAMRSARGQFAAAQEGKQAALGRARYARVAPDTSGYDRDMRQADQDYRDAEDKRAAILKVIDRPPFPTTIAGMPLDGSAPTATTAVATVAPPPVEVATAVPVKASTGAGKSGKVSRPPVEATRPPAVAARPDPAPPVAVATPVEPSPVPAGGNSRKVTLSGYAVAFPVAPDLLVTSAAAVADATAITVQTSDGDAIPVQVVTRDEASGLALLRATGRRLAYLSLADAYTGGAFQCVGFPTVNLFDPIAEAITGSAAAPPAGGAKWTVRLSRPPRLGGGPLLVSGRVVGVQLAGRDSDPGQVPAATLADLRKLVGEQAGPAAAAVDPKFVTMQLTAQRQKGR